MKAFRCSTLWNLFRKFLISNIQTLPLIASKIKFHVFNSKRNWTKRSAWRSRTLVIVSFQLYFLFLKPVEILNPSPSIIQNSISFTHDWSQYYPPPQINHNPYPKHQRIKRTVIHISKLIHTPFIVCPTSHNITTRPIVEPIEVRAKICEIIGFLYPSMSSP